MYVTKKNVDIKFNCARHVSEIIFNSYAHNQNIGKPNNNKSPWEQVNKKS